MANVRTINSAGVEIREIDISTRAITPVGTNVFVSGFAAQGPTYEIVNLSSLTEFETVYGTPTNAAERYFYYSVRQLFTDGANPTIKVARLPYGIGTNEAGTSDYSAMVYPVFPIPANMTTPGSAATLLNSNVVDLGTAAGYLIGEPALVDLTQAQYTSILQGSLSWAASAGTTALSSFHVSGANVLTDIAKAGIIVLNETKSTINEKFEGYYLNIGDSYSNNPATNYDDAIYIKSIGSTYFVDNQLANAVSYTTIPPARIGFALSASYTAGIHSTSQDIENIPTFNIAASGYDDTLVLSLFRVRPSPFSPNVQTLQYVLQEGYTGSLYSQRQVQDPLGGLPQSFYIKTIVDDNSNTMTVLVNPNIANATGWLDNNGNSTKKVRVYKTDVDATDPFFASTGGGLSASAILALSKPGSFNPSNNLYAVGTYSDSQPSNTAKIIGDVGGKLNTVLNLAENPEIIEIDLSIDAGLSTIYAHTQVLNAGLGAYDDNATSSALLSCVAGLSASNGNPVSNTLVDSWNTITGLFESFARSRRRDHEFISDPLRSIFVTGENYKTLDNKSLNFSQNIYWPLRNSYNSYNSSYATTYGNWAKKQDIFSSKPVWLPSSAFACAVMTASDAVVYPWGAAAGYNRGIINGITDIAINPQQKQRDLLAKISVNPIAFTPNDGYVVLGQKTLLKAPSAFDRNNVRRLFLFLEKATLKTMKYFVFEPNTTFTRSRAVNTMAPVFELAKNTSGLYDYLIVCNDSNNTADVIDDNTMVMDIYIKPVRTAEFILVNFYATKTSQNFNELLQG